jgi:hypothetical protein
MSDSKGDSHGGNITTLTTGYRRSDLLSGYEAMWSDLPLGFPLRLLKLQFQRPAERPDEVGRARYFAAWYGQEELPAAA